MEPQRNIELAVGVLLLLGTATGILSVVPSIDKPNFLSEVEKNKRQVIFGAFAQFIMATIYVLIPVLLFSIIHGYSQVLAVGFLSFRIVSAVFNFAGFMSILLILWLSHEQVNNASPEISRHQALGDLIKNGRDIINHIVMILPLCIAGLLLNYLLLQTNLMPHWLAWWGLFGTLLSMLSSILLLCRRINLVTPTYIIMNIPLAIQEMTLALFLLFVGFNRAEVPA